MLLQTVFGINTVLFVVILMTSIPNVSGLPPDSIVNSLLQPPLKQFLSGIPIHDIECKSGLHLIEKLNGNTPACVSENTAKVLLKRHWGQEIGLNLANSGNITDTVSAYFQQIRGNRTQLLDFFKIMPKGGDLHNHLSGSVSPEDLINLALKKGLCYNSVSYALVQPSNSSCTGTNILPVSGTEENQTARNMLVKSWSFQDFNYSSKETSHDHFFAAFGKIDAVTKYIPEMLGYWRQTNTEENMEYAEVMYNDPFASNEIKTLTENMTKSGITVNATDFQTAYDFLKGRIDKQNIAQKSVQNYITDDTKSKKFCDEYCDTTFRYIFQISRNYPLSRVFTNMVMGFEIANQTFANQTNPVVAVNMVAPEDGQYSMNNYTIHMHMLDFLKQKYPRVNITLHAGELSKSLRNISPEDMTTHIYQAINTGHAQRIGHGVDIQSEEKKYPNLITEMQEKKIAVEVPLTSNFIILNVTVEKHPFYFYLENNVPVAPSSDDQGILDTNMTNEYTILAMDYPQVNYTNIKNMIRNTLEHSFLPGKSLWQDTGEYKIELPQCNNLTGANNCWKEGIDEKAAYQFELEQKLDKFETHIYHNLEQP